MATVLTAEEREAKSRELATEIAETEARIKKNRRSLLTLSTDAGKQSRRNKIGGLEQILREQQAELDAMTPGAKK